MDIEKLSRIYSVRRLDFADIDRVLALCRENTQFYEYCGAEPTKAQIQSDLQLLPPGVQAGDKYYLGFFQAEELIAVLDLVDGYPEPETVFIGFFMMKKALQGQGLGSGLIRECAAYWKSIGFRTIRLGIDRDNPQSTHFWKKNGFRVVQEVDRGDWTILLAQKAL